MGYILKGSGKLITENAEITLSVGDAVYIPHGEKYYWEGSVDSGAGIFRIAKPATPNPHLVSYCLLLDPKANKALLVDHKKGSLWLATGEHVETNAPLEKP